MATEVRVFAVTVPANTTKATPATFPLTVPARKLRSVEVTIPAGCAGLVGFQLAVSGVNVLPVNAGAFITGNDRVVAKQTDGYPDSGAFQCIAYNTDIFPHTLTFELDLDMPDGVQPPAGGTPLANASLNPPVVPAV